MARWIALAVAVLLCGPVVGCQGLISDAPGGAATSGAGLGGGGGGGSGSGGGGTPAGGGGGGGTPAGPAGTGTGVAGTGGAPATCDGLQADTTPIRLLSQTEMNNTLADLLGDNSAPMTVSPAVGGAGYSNDATALAVSPSLVEQYMSVAETAATNAMAHRSRFVSCDPVAVGNDVCARQVIQDLGTRAFRRPIDDTEQSALLSIFDQGAMQGGFDAGMTMVVQAILESPDFLYHVEHGTPLSDRPDVEALDDWSIASRLSYFLWDTMPDADLFAAATRGELHTPAQIAAQANRMLDDPRAHAAVRRFVGEWLELDKLDGMMRDPSRYPDWSAALASAMKQETLDFVERVIFDGGDVSSLFVSPFTVVNPLLASFYGMPGPTTSGFAEAPLDARHRTGLLTQGSFLAVNAKYDVTSPVERGAFIRRRILCQPLPPPPPGVPPPPDVPANVTQRQRLEMHRRDPVCASCHNLMDPVGLTFESFDAIGRYRALDTDGLPVDTSGELSNVQGDVGGPLTDSIDLSNKLARSPDVRSCVAKQWFRDAFGRTETTADACTIADLMDRFEGAHYRLRDLLVAITQLDAFRYRATDPTDTLPEVCR